MFQSYITRRSIPYPNEVRKLHVPLPIWKNTISYFQEYSRHESEGLVFWGGGVGAAKELYVSSVIKINHKAQGYRVAPNQEEMRFLVRTLRERDEKLLAQVHSHPEIAYHSWGDDENPTAFFNGFFSIVVPDFGINVSEITQCAVFRYSDRFVQLSLDEVIESVLIIDPIVDLRVKGK